MRLDTRRSLLTLIAGCGAAAAFSDMAIAGRREMHPSPAGAKYILRFSDGRSGDYAIEGYDTTSYFMRGRAAKGVAAHQATWSGVDWLFESAEAAQRFESSPNAYAPQFGGYCTRAMSLGKVVPANSEIWRMRDDKLYLFAAKGGGVRFDKDPDGMIVKADAFWRTLVLMVPAIRF